MTRDQLVRMANADTWNRNMSRVELREIVALLDAKDARIRQLEAQAASTEVVPMPTLAAELRHLAELLVERVDELSGHLERRERV